MSREWLLYFTAEGYTQYLIFSDAVTCKKVASSEENAKLSVNFFYPGLREMNIERRWPVKKLQGRSFLKGAKLKVIKLFIFLAATDV